ncbi:hypothetical protein Tco_0670776 [Tanacetum coccineum]|uniref:Uncharacterized protein n=1 Tax=Tanacetum coccineum TaxID=301880 RepID=A0ABQ5G6T4_9ASTR
MALSSITRVFPYGMLSFLIANGPNFKVNGHRSALLWRERYQQLVVPDLQNFPQGSINPCDWVMQSRTFNRSLREEANIAYPIAGL